MHIAYHVRVEKDSLSFSAAHFISLDEGLCESLHGHDYRVAVEVHGPLNDQQYVVDFLALQQHVREQLVAWDHRVLLPERSPVIRVVPGGTEVVVTFGSRRWVFPAEDCCLLPVENTTSEALAGLLAKGLLERLSPLAHVSAVRVELHESYGQTAVCELRPG